MRRGSQLNLPLQNARAGRGGLRFGHVPGMLQRNGERGVRQRVGRGERCESQRGGDGLLQAAGVAQSADEAVMGLVIGRVGCDGCAKGLGRLSRRAGGEQVEAALGEMLRRRDRWAGTRQSLG